MSQVSVPLKYIYGSHRNANESFAEKREIKKRGAGREEVCIPVYKPYK